MNTAELILELNARPDLTKCASADLTPEQQAFLQHYQPGKRLIVYGTLAPSKPNHHIIAHIKGDWEDRYIKGELVAQGWAAEQGYKAFRPAAGVLQKEIPAAVLTSDELGANWAMLDEFEGDGYRRILTAYYSDGEMKGVGFIYAANDQH